jgi:hypothetical protein
VWAIRALLLASVFFLFLFAVFLFISLLSLYPSEEMDDIIELGEDGTFEIPVSNSTKQTKVEEIDYSSIETQHHISKEEKKDLLQSLKPLEYGLYRKKVEGKGEKDGFWLIVRLNDKDELKSLIVDVKHHCFILKTSDLSNMNVPFDEKLDIDVTSVQCKCFNGYVTILFKVK